MLAHKPRPRSHHTLRAAHRRTPLNQPSRFESLEPRCVLSTSYLVHDLVADQPGIAPITDPNLVNAWGIATSPTGGNFWVSSNGKDLSTVYHGDVSGTPLVKNSLEVTIPGGAPTGQVFNSTSDFKVGTGSASAPALFIFASEAGDITGWNPNVPASGSTTAEFGYQAPDSAVYKGLALASDNGQNFLYAADFHNNKIDVLNSSFQIAHLGGSFTDPNLPAGYAPFNVALLNGQLYVSYAKQDSDAHDDAAGAGRGFVDVFTTDGAFVQRLISQGKLNSPWGMTIAPSTFGDFSGDLLVGNFGDGTIHAYNASTGAFIGTLSSSKHDPVVVDGLWGLTFGNGTTAGDSSTLYFSAGPDGESHGLFGKITANPAGTSPVEAALTGDLLTITGGPDADHISVRLKHNQIVVQDFGQQIGSFDAGAVGTIQIQGFAGNDQIRVQPDVTAMTIVDGGAGNDKLFGGSGPNILLGGPDDDQLFGGSARDILIGGDGHDQLRGFRGDDILIGGSTTHDADTAALQQIMAEWNSTDSFNTRQTKLQTGAGGLPILDDTTVIDDGLHDHLFGGLGNDWFFAGTGDSQSQA